MFGGLVDGGLATAVADRMSEESMAELRLRINRPPLAINVLGERVSVQAYRISERDINGILMRATNMSLYSVSEELARGYVPAAGVRIGVGGEGVSDGGRLLGIKNISYLVIRVPHQVKSAADGAYERVVHTEGGATRVNSALIIAPPRGGKTTMLRELARRISQYKSTVIIDERYELACVTNGAPSLDVGDCEVVSGLKKTIAYENVLRSMSPEVLVTDELFRREEVEMICDARRAGIAVLASVHGEGLDSLKRSPIFAPLTDRFDIAIELDTSPVGRVRAVKEL